MAKIKLANLGGLGLVKDVVDGDLPPEAFTDVQNVRFNREGAQAFAGHRGVFKPAVINPSWIKPFPPVTNPLWVYGDGAKLFTWDGTEHQEITRVSAPYVGGPQDRWQGEVLNGVGIFNNGVDVPQMWLGFSPLQRLQDLSAWPTDLRAKWIRPFSFFLIAGGMVETGNERPYRVRWSNPAQPGSVPSSWDYADPATDAGEFDIAETSDYLVDGLGLGQIFVVYKERTAFAMQYVGGQNVFNKWQIIFDRGLLWRDCVQAIPGAHFAVGQDDIYLHTGQINSVQSLVQDKLRKWIFRQLSSSTYFNSFTMLNRAESEVWFCFPEAGATYATLAAVWNWTTASWGLRDLPETPFMHAGVVEEESELDLWGALDRYASGDMQASSAFVTAEVDRVNVASPTNLEPQVGATMTGSASVGIVGWPSDVPVYTGVVTESGGPLKLSQIPLISASPIPYNQQTARIFLTFSPGVVRTGDRLNPNQGALWLDDLYSVSQVILNLTGATLQGAAGAAEENGYPALIVEGNAPPYVKINGGTVAGGAAGSNGVQGYSIVSYPGATYLVQGATESGARQEYGTNLTATLSSSGLSAVVPNGLQVLGHVDVAGGGVANDQNPRLQITRVAGDPFVTASWDRSSILEPMKVVFTSDGINRRREATFEITLLDGVGRSVVAGYAAVQATHGVPSYGVTIDPSQVMDTVDLYGKNGANLTYSKTFTATVTGGVGPFLYNWSTTVGTIVSGQTTPSITLEQWSGYLSRGTDAQFTGQVTCTVTDQGNINDQISKVVSVSIFFDNSPSNSGEVAGTAVLLAQNATTQGYGLAILDESIGGGYLTAQGAQVAASVTVTPSVPITLNVTPDSVSESYQGPGTADNYQYTFIINLSAVVTNGVGPFTYDWSGKTGWTIINDGTANIQARRTLTCDIDAGPISYNGTLICTVTDQTTLAVRVDSCPISLQLTNPRARLLITGSGAMAAQSGDVDGSGFKTSPATMAAQIIPGTFNGLWIGASKTWNQALAASVTGGVGPYTYSWATTTGSFSSGQGTANVNHRVSQSASFGNMTVTTGIVTLTVTDTGRAGNPQVQTTATFEYTLENFA
jgi:hypothetical protein